ncbi:hypothetical protein K488DRAFT_89885 [Vararia minispora EC-137]|uniref:Uncharacterized protein n=1 Tax=Vararia minispora EC-137 TaxID=1314806 RepID=A0ACB8Q988_9AGAM|nr:hypothetical protein K488DRAFT_89885 [Vararia minispora EC-137]
MPTLSASLPTRTIRRSSITDDFSAPPCVPLSAPSTLPFPRVAPSATSAPMLSLPRRASGEADYYDSVTDSLPPCPRILPAAFFSPSSPHSLLPPLPSPHSLPPRIRRSPQSPHRSYVHTNGATTANACVPYASALPQAPLSSSRVMSRYGADELWVDMQRHSLDANDSGKSLSKINCSATTAVILSLPTVIHLWPALANATLLPPPSQTTSYRQLS